MDSYFDQVLNDVQFEPNPDEGADFVSNDNPSPEEVEAFWDELGAVEWSPF